MTRADAHRKVTATKTDQLEKLVYEIRNFKMCKYVQRFFKSQML